jgi:hypothetical protein
MKATIEIPDELYREVKAASARQGRRVPEVAAELFRDWVAAAARPHAFRGTRGGQAVRKANKAKPLPVELAKPARASDKPRPPWLGSLRKYAKNAKGRHDMPSIRRSIARGRAAEWAEREHF